MSGTSSRWISLPASAWLACFWAHGVLSCCLVDPTSTITSPVTLADRSQLRRFLRGLVAVGRADAALGIRRRVLVRPLLLAARIRAALIGAFALLIGLRVRAWIVAIGWLPLVGLILLAGLLLAILRVLRRLLPVFRLRLHLVHHVGHRVF